MTVIQLWPLQLRYNAGVLNQVVLIRVMNIIFIVHLS